MTTRQQQSLFVLYMGHLILWSYDHGYELTFGEAHRPEWVAAIYAENGTGIKSSLHCSRLAIDLNLFRDGKYLRSTDDHRPLGEKWKTLHPLCRWGGDFSRHRDGNHYSMTRWGRS